MKVFYNNPSYQTEKCKHHNNIIGIYRCVPKTEQITYGYSYLILYEDGMCKVGVDAFRLESKIDSPSYEIEKYINLDEALTHYRILASESLKKKGVSLCS